MSPLSVTSRGGNIMRSGRMCIAGVSHCPDLQVRYDNVHCVPGEGGGTQVQRGAAP